MGAMFVPTAFAYNIAFAPAPIFLPLPAPIATTTPKVLPQAPQSLQEKINALAKEYGQNPVLAYNIIRCEGMRYETLGNNKNWRTRTIGYNQDGTAITQRYVWSTDIGPWQINDYYHEKTMAKLGLNIHDLDDNLRYGFILLSTQGTQPWSASRYCWNK